ncbi:hypothetical protein [Chitinophaga tropicalis]|uniref:Lipocalin-like domain-containing protein n=1 Tax=Chitinophaga tropicalis TaxID=2683588 RepID=A0A7K1TX21_9BACT|nr:hypothetical protein [Chitinophaga tropicalis]MVT06633.1 hypothetical protein [Chitinophaga tropicalis]
MRSLLTLTSWLLLMLFCSCEKNDVEATPSIDVTGAWQLSESLTMPDSVWKPVAAADSAYYVFSSNGRFVFDAKTYHLTGTYKVIADGEKVKVIITGQDSIPQYLEVERVNDTSIKIDDWLKGVSKGQMSRKFVQVR